MKKSNKETLDMLRNQFGKSIDEISVPERLQKNNMVQMLENSKTDFSDKTGAIIQLDDIKRSKSASNATLRRSLSIAATLIIVIGCSLLIRMSNEVNIIKTEPTLNHYNAENMFRAAENYEEVEKAIQNILNPSSAAVDTDKEVTQNGNSSAAPETTAPAEQVTGSYPELGEYVIDSNSPDLPEDANRQPSNGISGVQADIVKNDGKNLYILTCGKDTESGKIVDCISIISAVPADTMQVISTIKLDETAAASSTSDCVEIYLQGNTLVAILEKRSNEATENLAYTKYQTVALYYDISDAAAPVKIREFVQDGSYVTSCVQGSKLCIVTDDEISDEIKNIVPSFSVNGAEASTPQAGNIYIATNNPQPAGVFMTACEISDSATQSEIFCAAFIGSDGDSIFVSGESFLIERAFVSVNADENGEYDNLTEIYRFDITETGIALVGSYIVEGAVCGSPSVDSSTGNLRVVASGKDGSALYILNNNMELVGWYDKIFPQTKIKAVKFIETACYIVALDDEETTLIIDITAPEKPKKLAQAPSADFSHKTVDMGGNMYIQVEVENESGINILLYDLSKPENITSADSYKILGNFKPNVIDDSRCIMLWEESKTFAIPTVSFNPETGSAVSSYVLFSYADGNLVYINSFDHDVNSNGNNATRCACIGDLLYTVSGEKVVAFSISQAKQLSVLELNS